MVIRIDTLNLDNELEDKETDKPEFKRGMVIPNDDHYHKTTIGVDLWYPRVSARYDKIQITLMDVRAANNITIMYDFDRDGWVVLSDCIDPDDKELDMDTDKTPWDLKEVAFIPAWPQKGEQNETSNTV